MAREEGDEAAGDGGDVVLRGKRACCCKKCDSANLGKMGICLYDLTDLDSRL